MKGTWSKWLFGLIAIGVIAYGAFLSLRERPVLVDLGQVTRGQMVVFVDEEGVTRVRDVYAVSSTLAGHLDRIDLEEGDLVSKGDVIATIHPLAPPFIDERTRTELEAAIEASRAAVALGDGGEGGDETAGRGPPGVGGPLAGQPVGDDDEPVAL